MTDIVLKNVEKTYGDKKVIDGFSAVLAPGKRYALMGPSGSGKTTVLRMIAGMESPDGGSIEGVPERISFVFQEDRLCPDFGAVGNIRLVTGDGIGKDDIVKNLCELGLGDDLDKPVKMLSGGMKRRVAIARALMFGGDLVLMDEPFVGLDEDLKNGVMDYVIGRTEGKTVLIVTHDREEAEYLGAEIICLNAE